MGTGLKWDGTLAVITLFMKLPVPHSSQADCCISAHSLHMARQTISYMYNPPPEATQCPGLGWACTIWHICDCSQTPPPPPTPPGGPMLVCPPSRCNVVLLTP